MNILNLGKMNNIGVMRRLDARKNNNYNSNVTLPKVLLEDTFERTSMNSGAKMNEEEQIKTLNDRINEIFLYNLEEPEYTEEQLVEHDEYPFIYLRKYYDSNGKLRKEIEEDSQENIRMIDFYDNSGIVSSILVKTCVQDDCIYVTKNMRGNNKHMDSSVYSVSLKDYTIHKVH